MADPNLKVRAVLEGLIADGGEIGLQVAAYLDGRLVVDTWAGLADETSGQPVSGETLFTGFSISKGITATCIHILADRGLVEYDAPIAWYWPEFAAKGKGSATVRQALTHQVGIPQDPPGFALEMATDWEAVCRLTAEQEPLWEPGTKTGYHALTYGWMLGEVLRRVDGRSIGQFLQEEVCRPLGVRGMYFGLPVEAEPLMATLKGAPGAGRLKTVVTPSLRDTAAIFNRPEIRRACIPGAGAIVNARSLARHYAMLAGGGEIDGVRLLNPERIVAATAEAFRGPDPFLTVFGESEYRWSPGYMLGGTPGPMAGRPQAFGYSGVGTIGFGDASQGFAFAFLKNLINLSPQTDDTAIIVTKAVEQALGLAGA
ncbi:MAG: serine hydrolase domain-containing protein [Chloroflexota bacterium]